MEQRVYLSGASPVTLDFGDSTINALSGPVDATSYFAGFGITESNVTAGAAPMIYDDRYIYGGGVEAATSPHNLLQGNGSNFQNNSYELDFPTPISGLSFYRVGLFAAPPSGQVYPQWTVTLYNDATFVGSVGESLSGYYTNQPARLFSITGTGNRLVVEGNSSDFAAFGEVGIDDLTYTPSPSAPTITSGNTATFTTGITGTFTVTTTGAPTPTLTETGTLPAGVTFTDNDDGTATLAGTPATAGTYGLTLTASNGVAPDYDQSFTLTVSYTLGIDVYHLTNSTSMTVNGQTVTTEHRIGTGWMTVKSTGGVAFAIAKAAQGTTFTDDQFSNNMLDGNAAGLVMGAYDYADPDADIILENNPSNVTELNNDAVAELKNFMQAAGAYMTSGYLQPALDLEPDRLDNSPDEGNAIGGFNTNSNNPIPGYELWNWTEVATWVNDWLVAFRNLYPSLKPMLYMDEDYAQHLAPITTAVDGLPISLTSSPLWITSLGKPNKPPTNTYQWGTNWYIMQYAQTQAVAGIAGQDPDLDVLNPSLTLSSLQIGASPTPPPPPIPVAWTGTSSDQWNDVNNWPNQAVPDQDESVSIAAGLPTIQISGGSFAVNSLSSGSPIEVDSGSLALLSRSAIDGSLTIQNGGGVDITNGSLAINYGTASGSSFTLADDNSPLSTIEADIASGYDNGAWDGPGIISSFAAANSNYAVGYADGSVDTGTAAQPGQVLVECTLTGDANLDGTVNLTDLLTLLNSYGQSGKDWSQGDFNYDGTVNLTDLLALLNNYGQSAQQITSSNSATFTAGVAGTFTVTTTGSRTPVLAEVGALPIGVTFSDNGNGTATLSGTPAAAAIGTYNLEVTAAGGVFPQIVQPFTLTVVRPPTTITSANQVTFAALTAGSFTVTTTGLPSPALTEQGDLPSGVSFVDNGDGTATLAGIPAADAVGTFSLTLTADNGVSPSAMQAFTLTVLPPPTFTVTTVADTGMGSLREAIADAASGGIINFASGVTGTIDLTSTLPAVSGDVVIEGPGPNQLTVNGQGHGSVFTVESGNGTSVDIEGLTITGGNSTPAPPSYTNYAGGIENYGTLTLTDCIISGNTSRSGGGIYNAGTLAITDSTISGNFANYGGGIFNISTLTVTRCVISGNSTTLGGVTGTDSGGVYNSGTLTFTSSAISVSSVYLGGGIDNSGMLTVTNSTISGNTAEYGGGIENSGMLTVTNSTIGGNTAEYGGGIDNLGLLAVTDSTISGNSSPEGGGVYNGGNGTFDGTIIAANPGGDVFVLAGSNITGSNDLIGDGSDGGVLANSLRGTLANPLNPLLAPLTNNGGLTPTMALLPNSPAIGTGANFPVLDANGNDITATDQRGVPRPTGSGIDIGAYQSTPSTGDANSDGIATNAWAAAATPPTSVIRYTVKSTPFSSEPLVLNSAGGLPGQTSNLTDADGEILGADSGAIL